MRPKWAQKRPKQPKMGTNAPKMTPNLVKGFPYVRPPYHHVFGPPTPGWRRSATTLLLKMAKNGPLEAEMGPKEAKTAQNGPKCPQNDPKPRKRFRCVKPPYHHVFGPPTPGWQRSAATLQLKNGQKWAPGGQNGPKRGQQQQATSRWASFGISGTPIA